MAAGYSGTPLVRKLGIRAGDSVCTIAAPKHYLQLVTPLPEGVSITTRIAREARFVHLFAKQRSTLEKELKRLRPMLAQDGMIWVSWPKKSAGVSTDITEDVVRAAALPLGFVDIKVCAVDEIWSGLKLVIRRENRRPNER